MKKIIIIAAPSGSGKTSIVRRLLAECPDLEFSISATTREPRGQEAHGIDYYFISIPSFEEKIKNDEFLEWEMVYHGKYYGTLRAEIDRIYASDKIPLLDIDVQGAVRLKKEYPDRVYSIFVQAPSLEVLRKRLVLRGTDTEEVINERVQKAEYETTFVEEFDDVVVNDVLDEAVAQTKEFLNRIFAPRVLFP